MTSKYSICLVLILVATVVDAGSFAHAQDIYWIGGAHVEDTRGNTIFRFALGGSVVDTLVQVRDVEPDSGLPRSFNSVTVDTLNRHIYWTDSGGTNPDGSIHIGAIMHASLDGADPDVLVSPVACGIGGPNDIEFDATGQTIYWGEGSDCPDVGLNALALGQPEVGQWYRLPMSANYAVSAIEVDASNEKLYWVNRDFFAVEPDGILRAPMADTESDEYIFVGSVCDIALAHGVAKIYWTPCGSGVLRRSNLDGSGAEDVLVSAAEINKLAVDGQAGKIYWTETAAGNIRRANLDGTGVENVLSGLTVPGSIALSSAGEVHTSIDPAYVLPDESGFEVNVYPNPVRDRATVEFAFTAISHATLTLYDVLGRQVVLSASRAYPAGQHSVEWDLIHLPGGVYFFHLTTEKKTQTIPLVVNR